MCVPWTIAGFMWACSLNMLTDNPYVYWDLGRQRQNLEWNRSSRHGAQCQYLLCMSYFNTSIIPGCYLWDPQFKDWLNHCKCHCPCLSNHMFVFLVYKPSPCCPISIAIHHHLVCHLLDHFSSIQCHCNVFFWLAHKVIFFGWTQWLRWAQRTHKWWNSERPTHSPPGLKPL